MAVTPLIEQHIAFIDINHTGTVDEPAIQSNSFIQSLAVNSQGGDLVLGYNTYSHWDGTVWTGYTFYEIRCYVQPSFQATIQQNIQALQIAFPAYTILTWGHVVQFGN